MPRLYDAKEDLELTPKTCTDVKFMLNLLVTGQNLDKEWELRNKTREEILAVSEALAFITRTTTGTCFTKHKDSSRRLHPPRRELWCA